MLGMEVSRGREMEEKGKRRRARKKLIGKIGWRRNRINR
jgi:hypothetical protein